MSCCNTNVVKPGQILILLAGSHRGKRVVYLKTMDSGLYLVTGPYKINGVPLRRVNKKYVKATSTCVDVSKVDVSKLVDGDFAVPVKRLSKKESKAKKENQIFAKKSVRKVELTSAFIDRQKKIDQAITATLKDGMMVRYLRSRFSLSSGMHPHQLRF